MYNNDSQNSQVSCNLASCGGGGVAPCVQNMSYIHIYLCAFTYTRAHWFGLWANTNTSGWLWRAINSNKYQPHPPAAAHALQA